MILLGTVNLVLLTLEVLLSLALIVGCPVLYIALRKWENEKTDKFNQEMAALLPAPDGDAPDAAAARAKAARAEAVGEWGIVDDEEEEGDS